MSATGAGKELDKLLDALAKNIGQTRDEVNAIARPDAGEVRLLDSITRMPLAEMSKALR